MTTKEQQGRLVLEACTGMHGDVAKELSLMLCTALDKQMDYRERLKEVSAWAVCAPIATAEDMMQNIEHIMQVATVETGEEAMPSSQWYLYSRYWGTDEIFQENRASMALLVEAMSEIFGQAASNGLFDAWQKPIDCTKLNDAYHRIEAVHKALATVEFVSDPHSNDRERARLPLGQLTDDELANAAFMHYDQRPDVMDIITGTAKPPIVYMTAIKERVRWLSRALQEAIDQLKETNELRRQRDNFKLAYDEWMEKTDWLKPSTKELGMHRADILAQRYRTVAVPPKAAS